MSLRVRVALLGSPKDIAEAINDLDKAAQAFALKGSKPPSEWEFIEALYERAKLRLRVLTGVVEPTVRRVSRMRNLEAILLEGYDGPTEEERGG